MTAGVRSTADEVWTCDCGQSYRVTGVNGRVRLWPRDGNASYSPQGITPRCRCIRCGQPSQLKQARPAPTPTSHLTVVRHEWELRPRWFWRLVWHLRRARR